MRDKLIIIGGVLCAVTGLVPIIHITGEYSEIERVLNASGLYLGSGLIILGASIGSKIWPYLRTISALIFSFSITFFYDKFIDITDKIHTYHYAIFILIVTILTLIICLYYKLRQRRL